MLVFSAFAVLTTMTTTRRHGHQRSMSSVDISELYAIDERPADVDDVRKVVTRHLEHAAIYDQSRPAAKHTLAAFRLFEEKFQRYLDESETAKPRVIVDGGCGLARSTHQLAQLYPETLVVGVDRSAQRLERGGAKRDSENKLLLRAELGDFWRLIAKDDTIRDHIFHTTLLYPNPYPKREHLKRRWYGHPVFPTLLATAGQGITLRATWRTYLDEFALALTIAADYGDPNAQRLLDTTPTLVNGDLSLLRPHTLENHLSNSDNAMTHFEAKYISAAMPLYELQIGRPLLHLPLHPPNY